MSEAVRLGDVTRQAMVVITERMFKARPDMPEAEKLRVKDALRRLQSLAIQPPD